MLSDMKGAVELSLRQDVHHVSLGCALSFSTYSGTVSLKHHDMDVLNDSAK